RSKCDLLSVTQDISELRFVDFGMVPAYSYVSVVELSNYLPADEDPYQNPQILARLYPELPKANHICFYPMDKRRQGDDNWYIIFLRSSIGSMYQLSSPWRRLS
ncbi:chlorite dismutase family protein, partial [Bacillus sp. D-CC]